MARHGPARMGLAGRGMVGMAAFEPPFPLLEVNSEKVC